MSRADERRRKPQMGIFARTFALVFFVPSLFFAGFVLIRLPVERNTAVATAAAQANALATVIARLHANAFATNDYAALVDVGSQMLQGEPDLRYLIISKPGGPNLVFVPNGWEERQASDPDCAALSAAGTRMLESNPLTPDRVIQVSHALQIQGLDWGVMRLGMGSGPFDVQTRIEHRRILAACIAGVLVSAALALLFVRRLTAPLFQLRAITDRIMQGDLTARADIHTGDELEMLAISINAMAESIRQSQGALQEANARLELGVTERTLRLMDSEEDLRILVGQTSAGICVLEQGLVHFWNPAISEMLGGSGRDLAGTALIQRIHRQDQPAFLELLACARDGQSPSPTARLRFEREGGLLWARVTCSSFTWKSRPALLLTTSAEEVGQG